VQAMKYSRKDMIGANKAAISSKALLHSRTVVEKEGYVSTGTLAHIEGEMMEIEMTEFRSFELGNPVHLTIYSPVGTQRIQTSVIAKAEGSITVIFPAGLLVGLEEKRESPRFEVTQYGTIKRKMRESRQTKDGTVWFEAEDHIELSVRNISSTGIGFIMSGGPALNEEERLEAVIMLGFELQCTLEIIRKDSDRDQTFYGARFHDINDQQQRALRAYLLREQIAAYYRRKESK
jgi:hypothetical protein